MNTLLSIFHLLLMLTHNRVMPDMQGIWEQISSEKNIGQQTAQYPVLQTPTEKTAAFLLEAVRTEDKEAIPPTQYSQEPIFHLLARKQVKWPWQQLRTIKRYLVFCQMKTEG